MIHQQSLQQQQLKKVCKLLYIGKPCDIDAFKSGYSNTMCYLSQRSTPPKLAHVSVLRPLSPFYLNQESFINLQVLATVTLSV